MAVTTSYTLPTPRKPTAAALTATFHHPFFKVRVNFAATGGLADKTIIAIASDHGEAFLEHGVEGHARNLYQEVQDVPLILYLPFRLDPGITVNTPVANVDLWPTLLDLLGLPV